MFVSEIPALRDYWYPVAYSADVTDQPIAVRVFGDPYVVWRAAPDTPASIAIDECPHRNARLSQGWLADGCLVCPYHGWSFGADGVARKIPSNEDGLPIPPRARLEAVLAEEKYGLVWVCVGMPRAPVPALTDLDSGEFTLVHELMEEWRASAPRIIDNGLDVSHVSWVHRNSVGSSTDPIMNDVTVHRDGMELSFSATYTVNIDEKQHANTGIPLGLTTRTTRGELVNPLIFRGALEYHANGLVHVLYKTATPIDDETTLFCQFVARNDAPDAEKIAGIIAVDRVVQSEDKVLLERIRPEFPLEAATEIHTAADKMTIQYRRILADLAAEHSLVKPDSTWARPLFGARESRERRLARHTG
jgi:phenylpropionate dioxygenase-like ring-hydroxylating dioxygenase large terminal subunit